MNRENYPSQQLLKDAEQGKLEQSDKQDIFKTTWQKENRKR